MCGLVDCGQRAAVAGAAVSGMLLHVVKALRAAAVWLIVGEVQLL
jgi:hypothetical protein